jgi:hypothetical protein
MHLDYRRPGVGCQAIHGAPVPAAESVAGKGTHSGGVVETLQPERRRKQDYTAPESRGESLHGSPLLSESLPKVSPAESWGGYIETIPGGWLLTLTFRGPTGEWGAERKFRRLVRQMRHDAGHRVEWLRVTEWHKFRNVPHYHALMLDVKKLRRMRYVDWWWGHGYGTARVFQYDTRLGAGHYLGKYLTKQDSDLSVSRGLGLAAGVSDGPQGLSQMPLQSQQRPAG